MAVSRIVKCDFPTRFPKFVEQVAEYLNSPDFLVFHGALLCLYSLVQVYEHKTNDKKPLPEAMNGFLPIVYQRMCTMVNDISEESLTLQKLVLKIFYRYTDYYFPATSINEQVCVCNQIYAMSSGSLNGTASFATFLKISAEQMMMQIVYIGSVKNGLPAFSIVGSRLTAARAMFKRNMIVSLTGI